MKGTDVLGHTMRLYSLCIYFYTVREGRLL